MMNMQNITDKQKQIGLAVAVVLAAIGFGYVVGKRPADMKGSEQVAVDGATPAAGTKAPVTGGTKAPAASGTTGNVAPTGSEQPVAAPAKAGSISLAAKAGNGGISFSWSMKDNLTAPFGFYIYRSTTSSPSFPRDPAKYVADPKARSFTWDIQDGGTYWFRICTWNGKSAAQSGCLTNSAAVKVVAPTASAATQNPFDYTETELGLAGRVENDGVRLFWSQTTSAYFTSYKVVRSSTDTNPYYPKTAAVLTLNNKTDVGSLDVSAVKGNKYFYRVCVVRSNANPQCGNVWTVQY